MLNETDLWLPFWFGNKPILRFDIRTQVMPNGDISKFRRMEDPNSTLLPDILEALSRKPELCDSFDNIYNDIQERLAQQNNCKYGNVRNALQRALNVGQNLGILTVTDETIRARFNFRTNNKKARAPAAGGQQTRPSPQSSPPPETGGGKAKASDKKTAKNVPNKEESEYMLVAPKRLPAICSVPRGRSRVQRINTNKRRSLRTSSRRAQRRPNYGRRTKRRR